MISGFLSWSRWLQRTPPPPPHPRYHCLAPHGFPVFRRGERSRPIGCSCAWKTDRADVSERRWRCRSEENRRCQRQVGHQTDRAECVAARSIITWTHTSVSAARLRTRVPGSVPPRPSYNTLIVNRDTMQRVLQPDGKSLQRERRCREGRRGDTELAGKRDIYVRVHWNPLARRGNLVTQGREYINELIFSPSTASRIKASSPLCWTTFVRRCVFARRNISSNNG